MTDTDTTDHIDTSRHHTVAVGHESGFTIDRLGLTVPEWEGWFISVQAVGKVVHFIAGSGKGG